MRTNSKKHWYDKPLKFLYFLAMLFPCFLFLGNYIMCQMYANERKVTYYTYNNEGNLTQEYIYATFEDGNILYPEEYYGMMNFNPPLQSAIYYTNIILGNQDFDMNNGEETPNSWGNVIIYPPFINDFALDLIRNNLIVKDGYNTLFTQLNWRLDFLAFNVIFYEIYITCMFILLKVILFLPNVVVYLLDWTERKLNV